MVSFKQKRRELDFFLVRENISPVVQRSKRTDAESQMFNLYWGLNHWKWLWGSLRALRTGPPEEFNPLSHIDLCDCSSSHDGEVGLLVHSDWSRKLDFADSKFSVQLDAPPSPMPRSKMVAVHINNSNCKTCNLYCCCCEFVTGLINRMHND